MNKPKYQLEISNNAKHDLKALPLLLRKRVDNQLLSLQDNLRPHGVKKLKSEQNQYVSVWVIFG